jgi:hypothetical protein
LWKSSSISGPLRHAEAHGDEDVDDLLLDGAQRVHVTARPAAAGQRHVDTILGEPARETLRAEGPAACVQLRDERLLHLVGERAHGRALRRGWAPRPRRIAFNDPFLPR